MANMNPKTAHLVPLTSERAREIASKRQVGFSSDPLVQVQFKLHQSQLDALKKLDINRSELVRTMIDAYLAEILKETTKD